MEIDSNYSALNEFTLSIEVECDDFDPASADLYIPIHPEARLTPERNWVKRVAVLKTRIISRRRA